VPDPIPEPVAAAFASAPRLRGAALSSGAIVLFAAIVAACTASVLPAPAAGGGYDTATGLPQVDTGGGVKKDVDSGATGGAPDAGADVAAGTDLDAAAEDVCSDDCPDSDDAGDDAQVDTAAVDTYTGPLCTFTGGCKGLTDTPFCAVSLKQCVECLTDFNCADGKVCTNFVCKPIACTPGATWCDGAFLATCNGTGDGTNLVKCPPDAPLCQGGNCALCEPGKTFCAPIPPGQQQSKAVLKCADDGSGADVLKSCNAGEKCSPGKDFKPYCQSCTPGDQTCQGDDAMVCADDGSGYELHVKCAGKGLTCQGGLCVNPCDADKKYNTNVGCDYWAVDLDNAKVPNGSGGYYDAQNSQFSVIISNTKDKPALVTVEAGTGQKQQYTVQAKGLKILDLPDPLWKVPALNQDNTNINKNVYRIKSDQPIVAYQFNPLQNYDVFSNDASLLLPSNAVGTDYWVMTREQSHELLRSYFTVVAVKAGKTHVTVTSSAKTLPGPSIPAMKPGDKQTFTLDQGQVLNVETNAIGADLTGTYIHADNAIAVFGGSEASNSPNSDKCDNGKCKETAWPCTSAADCPKTCCADHLEEQLFPVSSWGKVYHATKLKKRNKEKDAWRILAAEADTVVTTVPAQGPAPKLAAGGWFEIESDQDFVITANKPIQVAQFMASANAPLPNNDTCTGSYQNQKVCGYYWNQQQTPISCAKHADCPNIPEPTTDAGIGDPAMINGVSVDQYLAEYVFLVPSKYKDNFVNVIAPTGSKVQIDGAVVPVAQWATFATGWQVARLAVNLGVHTLKSDQKVGLIVYGWADYVSYGYPGGAAVVK